MFTVDIRDETLITKNYYTLMNKPAFEFALTIVSHIVQKIINILLTVFISFAIKLKIIIKSSS